MSSPANLPALQAVTPNGIHTYLTQAAEEIRTAAAAASLETLKDCSERVTAIYESVTGALTAKPVKPNGSLSSRTLEQIAIGASGVIDAKTGKILVPPKKISSGEAFNFVALLEELVTVHEAALALFEQLASEQPAPSPTPSQQDEQQLDESEFRLVCRGLGTPPLHTEQGITFTEAEAAQDEQQPAQLTSGLTLPGADAPLVNPFATPDFTLVETGLPFVFTAETTSPLSVIPEQEEAPAAERSRTPVPPLNLTALVNADDAVKGPDRQRSHSARSEAPSDHDEPAATTGTNTLVATDGKVNAGQPAAVPVDDSEESGDELAEDDDQDGKVNERQPAQGKGSPVAEEASPRKDLPTDILVVDEEETSNCRPGRKTACAAVTAALGGVGYFFKDAIVQAGSTVVVAATTHAPVLWNGVREAATTHGSALWNGVKEAVLAGGYKALNATFEQCESDEDVTPGLPGVKPKHVVAATVAASATALVIVGYCASRVAKRKQD